MARIYVRNFKDWIVAAFRERAKRNRRSLEAEQRDVLREEALRTRRRIAAELNQLRDSAEEQYRPLADTTAIIRRMRDAE